MATTLPDFKKSNFHPNASVDHPYLPLPPGTIYSYSGETGDGEVESNDFFATYETRKIAGVNTIVVRDTAYQDGILVEDTFDWHAQDKDGNVWYLGELAFNYEYDDDGILVEVNTDGSWEAGVPLDPEEDPDLSASPGYIMPNAEMLQAFIDSAPELADRDGYFQEFAPEVAVDEATVDSLDQEVSIGLGDFTQVLRTFETTDLEPDVADYKYYAEGLGLIRVEELNVEDDLAVDLAVELTGVRDLNALQENAVEELAAGDFVNGGSEMYVTLIGADGDHALGAYTFDKKGVLSDGTILVPSTEDLDGSSSWSVELGKKSGLGLFIIPDGGELDDYGIDLSAFEEGGLTFTNPLDFGEASLHDGVAPLASDGPLNFESPVNLPEFDGEEGTYPLPLQIFHAFDSSVDGINLLNPAGAVQATELDWENGEDELELTLLGFEDKRITDPEHDGDYNDVILAVSDSPLDAGFIEQLATELGYDADPLAA